MPNPKSYKHRASKELVCESASALKNSFGAVIKSAQTNGAVAITRHNQREFVILPANDYDDLVQQANGDLAVDLDDLKAQYDAIFERMQTQDYSKGMERSFLASTEELGYAAVKQVEKN
ncbi:MAG: type II toxin-antitoxin system prevent-host-death family antitoxin [Verrucomicrobia bacterium]|nr:type II toxin-antitoxin system prevent-host-death family antitoxin [Verrucomicrobiota bacterium]MDA1069357.1 type II toxin-antitoxin system prevent-host-death family antitoxin [Verrucomicrobiota bacterium]